MAAAEPFRAIRGQLYGHVAHLLSCNRNQTAGESGVPEKSVPDLDAEARCRIPGFLDHLIIRNIMELSVQFFCFDNIDEGMRIDGTDERDQLSFRFCINDRVDQSFFLLFIAADPLKESGIMVRSFPDRFVDLFRFVRDSDWF